MNKTERLFHLDMIRGVAAMLVMLGHLRAFVLQSYTEMTAADVHVGPIVKLFYFATGLGHQAVIVFFALSGFLVGGKAFADILNDRFSWPRYLLRRLTRLWLVVIPALLLTFALDSLGIMATGGAAYDGRYYDVYYSGPKNPDGIDLSGETFLGNLIFLQTVSVGIFGTNSPIWSLSNEFWYYVIFPLIAWVGLSSASRTMRGVGAALAVLLLFELPQQLLIAGSIWVAGALAGWCVNSRCAVKASQSLLARFAGLIVFFVALAGAKSAADGLVNDMLLGVAVALVLPVLAHLPAPGRIYQVTSRALSEISYTLYLTHFPFLTLIIFSGFAPGRLPPGLESWVIYVSLAAVNMLWAGALWCCFERHTDRLYAFLSRQSSALMSKPRINLP
jgi:peptidoglycan/LPS O-acetylase OafA/YrhL